MKETAQTLLALARSRTPTLGPGRLVCIDGPAGSGKTTLAGALGALDPAAMVLHSDDLLEGWGGLTGLASTLENLLRDLAAGRTGRWRRWDWCADRWAEWHEVEPGGLLILEGVGTGAPTYADLVTLLVWVEADAALRLARGLERDGEDLREHWLRWREEEDTLHRRDRTAARADVRVDGETGRWVSRVAGSGSAAP